MIDIDFNVYKKNSQYSNNYTGSQYTHWELDRFKHINLLSFSNSKNIFFDLVGNKRVADTEVLMHTLFNYYRDLNIVLNRLLNNVSDQMFRKFAFKAIMFKYENIFNHICNNWDEIFNDACYEYITKTHSMFDESYGISYVAFFDLHFSQVLYLAYVNYDYNFNKTSASYSNTYLKNNLNRYLEVYRLSWIPSDLFYTDSLRLYQKHCLLSQ